MTRETIRKRISNKISLARKLSKGFLKIDKFTKDMKYLVNDIKPTKRKHIPKAIREAVFKRDNYCCVKCGSTKNLEVDHKVSLANGGTNEMANLQTLCQDCNRRKGVS